MKAAPSDRFRTNFDRREAYLAPDFAAADWILAAYLNGQLDPAPRPLTESELAGLDVDGTFRLLFGVAPQKVRRERIAYLCSLLERETFPARLVRSGIVDDLAAQGLALTLRDHLDAALAAKEQRHALMVEVLSRYGLRLPSPTYADRADLWVAWGVAIWVVKDEVVRVSFRTPLDAQEVFRRVRERDQYLCAWCGGEGTTFDHLLLRSDGGLDTPLNGVCSCKGCNSRRGDMGLRRWVRGLADPPRIWVVEALCRRPRGEWLRGRRLGRSVRLPRYGKMFER